MTITRKLSVKFRTNIIRHANKPKEMISEYSRHNWFLDTILRTSCEKSYTTSKVRLKSNWYLQLKSPQVIVLNHFLKYIRYSGNHRDRLLTGRNAGIFTLMMGLQIMKCSDIFSKQLRNITSILLLKDYQPSLQF